MANYPQVQPAEHALPEDLGYLAAASRHG